MPVQTGLDKIREQDYAPLKGRNIALLCNQASIDSQMKHIIDLLLPLRQKKLLNIRAVFGPQHGLWGHTQDNMIEWEGFRDSRTGLTVYSLYGEHRKPTPEMLEGIDLLLVDLPDIGSRYYTFIWTMALCMEACQEQGIEVLVLDRPNPISGSRVEGTVLDPAFSSFVGLFPLPQRHGMTIGEIARYLQQVYFPALHFEVVHIKNWQREMYFPETGLPWAMPSPNMPLWETALVYPGMCLLEATNLSEGRGTTRPFEIFGTPWIDGWRLCDRLNRLPLKGVYFRPIQFLPTFHKFSGEVCEGAFLHSTDRDKFQPVLTTIALLQEIVRQYPGKFEWKQPPYEYEYRKLPFDILAGNDWLREAILDLMPLDQIRERFREEVELFKSTRKKFLCY